MDDADRAAMHEEAERDNALARHGGGGRLRPVGYCRSCLATLGKGAVFCDASCGADWEREEAAARRNGR